MREDAGIDRLDQTNWPACSIVGGFIGAVLSECGQKQWEKVGIDR